MSLHLPLELDRDPIGAPPAAAAPRPIAVIGAGFSGTMAALHLLRRLPPTQPVLLCERADAFGRGLAYSTGDSDHLLNVRAPNMSALHDDPEHFQDWLDATHPGTGEGIHLTEAGLFASRGLYGRYLRSLLDEAMRENAAHARLRLLPDEAHDLVPETGGYALHCASGRRYPVAGAVLATGNLPVPEAADERWCSNPWSPKTLRPLEGDLPVLILGTGLTMVDLVTSFRKTGFTGKLIALSRGGKLPQRHLPTPPWPTPRLTEAEQTSMAALTHRIRAEIREAARQGIDWRAVIDSLRPVTASLWQGLPEVERSRFLRHARRWWDTHRHRMAPPNARMIDDMLRSGALEIRAGHLRGYAIEPDAITVRYRPRGAAAEATLRVQRVVAAIGTESVARTRDLLIRRLLERGLVRLDPHGLGLAVDDTLRAATAGDNFRASANDAARHRIWALGPIVRGVFWECTAVPDIRGQAARVAQSVTAALREEAPRWSYMI